MKKVTYIISDIDKALAFEWIAEKLDHSQIDLSFILILQKPSELETFLKRKGIPVHCFYYKKKTGLLFILPQVYTTLKKLKSETVHCHLLYGSLFGLTAAWLAGIPRRIYTRHHSDFHHRYFPSGIKWDRWCNKLSTRVIAPSSIVKNVLVSKEGMDPAKVTVIHHGFDLEYFRYAKETTKERVKNKYNSEGQYPVVGVISRFTEWKGIQDIIPAFRNLLKNYPNALLLLFNAQGDYEKEIKSMLEDIPKRNLKLIKFENDVSACYQLFDVFVHAPVYIHGEAFGQIYVEALAAGIPSVFTLSGIAQDFVEHEKNALVVDYRNSRYIYHSLRRILEDQELREKLITEGWNSVKERFALQRMIKQLENVYEKG